MMLPLLYVPAPLQKGANIYHSVGCLFGSFYRFWCLAMPRFFNEQYRVPHAFFN